jgi:hypothetical protein
MPNAFLGLKPHLKKWFYTAIRMDDDLKGKMEAWTKAHDHYINPSLPVKRDQFAWKHRSN